MGNAFPGVAGDPNNNCLYCALGKHWGWEGKNVFHTHDDTTPKLWKETDDEDIKQLQKHLVDPLTYLGADVQVNKEEMEKANKSIHQFFAGIGLDPKVYREFDIVLALAKISKYRIYESLNISEDIQTMLEHAKMGDFDTAIRILEKHHGTCIANCIPPNRAWGLLHQAAYFNNFKAAKKILENPKCDPYLRTKIPRDGVVEFGSTADTIATDENVINIIMEHQKIRSEALAKTSKPDLVSIDSEKDIEVESIMLMINTFKKVFHPKTLSSMHDMIYSNLMLNVFNYINTGNNWERARIEISLQLQSLNVYDAIFLATGKEKANISDQVFEKKRDFFSRVIRLYTKECQMRGTGHSDSSASNTIYRALNYSLLKKGCEHSFVSGEDLALAAYGLLLNAILMYWTNLVPTNAPTYRGMELSAEQIVCYKEGQTLTWLCFSSSSLNPKIAEMFNNNANTNTIGKTVFICDNSHMTKYAAKSIKEHSKYPNEEEYLYPSGARFRITKIEKTQTGTKLFITFEDY